MFNLDRIPELIKAAFLFFILSAVSFIVLIFNIHSRIKDISSISQMIIEQTDTSRIIFMSCTLITIITFFVGITLISEFITQNDQDLWNKSSFKFFIIFVFLPFYLFIKYLKCFLSEKTNLRLIALSAFLILMPIWVLGYYLESTAIVYAVKSNLGFIPVKQEISGTGSMYPTFPKGNGKTDFQNSKQIVATPYFLRYPNGLFVFDKRYFNYSIGRKDIVVFSNLATSEITKKQYGKSSGYVKRVIGLPGDKIELRAGIVYLNDKPQLEAYIFKPRSTFAGTFLPECTKVTVPNNKIFVMGDNRKGSSDSRDLGFIDLKDVEYVLPLKDQKGSWDKNWRNSSNDLADSSKIYVDKSEYLKLLNLKRQEAGVKSLTYQNKLENSANKRGQVILKYDDFSWEASKSGYTMKKAINEAGYSNIILGEAHAQGYYDASELLDNQMIFENSKSFLLNNEYQEFGISEVEGQINNCPTQVIVQHFAGYVPPNYTKTDIDAWKLSLSKLEGVKGGWLKLKEYPEIYGKNKKDIDRINEIIATRISNTTLIIARMAKNQWLTNEEQQMASNDKKLFEEQEKLATKLNSN